MNYDNFYHTSLHPRKNFRFLFWILGLLFFFFLPMAFRASIVWSFQVKDMETPESFIVDAKTGTYYVSNVDGNPLEKDRQGFISKIGTDGRLINLRFIDSINSGGTLNAPKGMAIWEDDLYVTDIDRVLRFDKQTGKLRGVIDLTALGAVSLEDLTDDGEQALFVSDMIGNTIYKIEPRKGWRVTNYASGSKLAQPNGLLYDKRLKRLIIASWKTGRLLGLNSDGSVIVLFKNPELKTLDGLAFDSRGNILFSSFLRGKVYRLKKYTMLEVLRENIITPANISVDKKNNLVLVPSLRGNLVFTFPLN